MFLLQERGLQDKMRGKATTVDLTLGLRATRAARNAGQTDQGAGLGDSCREEVQLRLRDSEVSLTCMQGGAEQGDDTQDGGADHGQVPLLISLKETADEVEHEGGKERERFTVQDKVAGATGQTQERERVQAGLPRNIHRKSKEGRTHGLRYSGGGGKKVPRPGTVTCR